MNDERRKHHTHGKEGWKRHVSEVIREGSQPNAFWQPSGLLSLGDDALCAHV